MLIVFFPLCPAWLPRQESPGMRVAAEPERLRSPCLQCCQLFLQNFSASPEEKCDRWENEILSPSNFHFLKEFGLTENTFIVCMRGKILFLDFPQIREYKRRETILKFGPVSAPFVLNKPKFGRRFVRPLHILFGPFWLIRPNNRPAGNNCLPGGADAAETSEPPDSEDRRSEGRRSLETCAGLGFTYDFRTKRVRNATRVSFYCSVADPGSGIQDPVPFWPRDPGWVKKSRSKWRSYYFLELRNNFLG